MNRNLVRQAIANPAKNLFAYTVITSGLAVATTGIANSVLDPVSTLLQSRLPVDKGAAQFLIGLLICVLLLLIDYLTDISEWLTSFLANFGIGNFVRDRAIASPLKRTFPGLIVIMSAKDNSPAERAIRHHWNQGQELHLRHCWVICTVKSLEFAKNMINQFTLEGITQKVQFHYGNYELSDLHHGQHLNLLMEDAIAENPAYILRLVDAIYTDAQTKGLEELEVIADYTGGTKSMTVGLVLAGVSPKRHLQYISQTNAPEVMEMKISYQLKPLKSISEI